MIEFALVVVFAFFVYRTIKQLRSETKAPVQPVNSSRLAELVEYAERLYRAKKLMAAEKAYLGVLKLDHKNLKAYNRLGIIYSAQRNYSDAIECFQISSRLSPSGQSYQNLGLAYYENQNYIKAIAALEKATMFEPAASRYIAMAKSYQKLTNLPKVAVALEKAVELDPSAKHLTLLAEAYAANHERGKAEEAWRRVLKIDPKNPKARHFVSTLKPA